MPKITLNSGARFQAEPGISILDAAILSGTAFPYSCRTGRCSTCKCKVIEGETTLLQAEIGLSPEEKADGWILGCVRAADVDLTLEAEDLGNIALPPVKTLPCRISSIDRPASDVVRLMLRLPPSSAFEYLPGQYVELIGPDGIRRSYSLAAAGSGNSPLELHVRAISNGEMSEFLFQRAQANDLLHLRGPLGTFFLRNIADIDLYFLATGTGIAPIKAILESLETLEQRPRSITVLWGGRTLTDLYLDIAAIPGSHRFIPVLSRADDEWNGARGHVQDILLGLQPDLSNAAVYACGSDAMIHDARKTLLEAGLSAQHFNSDAFVCSAASINRGQ